MERLELARRLGAGAPSPDARSGVVCERDPEQFRKAFAAAAAGEGDVFLYDPSWGPEERAQADAARAANRDEAGQRGWLCIPTGGSSGRIKFARHDQDTISAAVEGFRRHFSLSRVNAVGLLPLHHVSGLMAWMRCAITDGIYLGWDWRELAAGNRPDLKTDEAWVLSLVPTQLARLMEDPAAIAWLRRFAVIFIGGGPSWPELVERGAALGLPLSFSYGMTETAAMVTALRPEEFRAGLRGSGRPLPHATVEVGADGAIAITGPSLFRGYVPDRSERRSWCPEDIGRWLPWGGLEVLGRRDGLIITGGEKVDPLEVESVLRSTGAFSDVVVLGVADPTWGEAVTAFYPAASGPRDLAGVERAVAARLAPYKQPKRYVAVRDWPRNEQGKVNRALLRTLAG